MKNPISRNAGRVFLFGFGNGTVADVAWGDQLQFGDLGAVDQGHEVLGSGLADNGPNAKIHDVHRDGAALLVRRSGAGEDAEILRNPQSQGVDCAVQASEEVVADGEDGGGAGFWGQEFLPVWRAMGVGLDGNVGERIGCVAVFHCKQRSGDAILDVGVAEFWAEQQDAAVSGPEQSVYASVPHSHVVDVNDRYFGPLGVVVEEGGGERGVFQLLDDPSCGLGPASSVEDGDSGHLGKINAGPLLCEEVGILGEHEIAGTVAECLGFLGEGVGAVDLKGGSAGSQVG